MASNSLRGAQSATKKPLQVAAITKIAEEVHKSTNTTAEQSVLDRIQKLFYLAEHPGTSEAVAKTCLLKAHYLMSKHNVTEADRMANDNRENKAHYGGRSVVTIRNTLDPSKRVVKEAFVRKVANAMEIFFDCKCLSCDRQSSVDWLFYGIAENTAAAAMGFEMAHNKILDWACAYKGGSPTFSYRLGVADGLVSMANNEKHREIEEVRRKELDIISAREREERNERERELKRLHNWLPMTADSNTTDLGNITSNESERSSDELSDALEPMDVDDSDHDMKSLKAEEGPEEKADFTENNGRVTGLMGDVDDFINNLLKQELSETVDLTRIPTDPVKLETPIALETDIKDEKTEQSLSSPWASETQLVRFRATSEQVADDFLKDFLKERNLKLRRRKPRPSFARTPHAYRQGRKDSAKINVRQRCIE